MSTYNNLKIENFKCPRCSITASTEIEFFAGSPNCIEYKIEDKIQWLKCDSIKKGGRPPKGNFEANGYFECNKCKKDAFIKVIIKDDKIQNVEYDPSKKPHIE